MSDKLKKFEAWMMNYMEQRDGMRPTLGEAYFEGWRASAEVLADTERLNWLEQNATRIDWPNAEGPSFYPRDLRTLIDDARSHESKTNA